MASYEETAGLGDSGVVAVEDAVHSISDSEKQATDVDAPDAAGDTASAPADEAGGNADNVDGPADGPADATGGEADATDATDEVPGAYDPSAAIVPLAELASDGEEPSATPAPAPAPAPAPTAKKPKARGGFVDSDSEDDDNDNGHDNDDGDAYDPSQLETDAPATSNTVPVIEHRKTHQEHRHQEPLAYDGAGPDSIASLEARVAEDPRGAVDAWLALIGEHRASNRFEEARSAFGRMLKVFPQAAEVWVDWVEMELELENFGAAEELFGKSLPTVVHVPLWTVYLDYVRRRNNLHDAGTEARSVVSRAYEFVLDKVGVDKESGAIWADYVEFIRTGPGTIGGSSWQDQQKMDQLRKAFRRATSVPIHNVTQLWKEYDQFEMGLNKITGRKFLAERSPAYMSAKSANTALQNMTAPLSTTTVARLPPVAGFEGHQEYMAQVELWQRWIDWEKADPLDLATDEPAALQARILYCYKQALMPLRFWPAMWVEAAEWCFEQGVRENDQDRGLQFLTDGIEANPESILLALKHADRIESTFPAGEGDDAKIAKGAAVRAPYDTIIATLRALYKGLQDREKAEVERLAATSSGPENDHEHAQKLDLIKQGFAAQMDLVSKCLTHVWIALARAMRRIQGKGSPQGPLGGLRQVFAEARKGGRLKCDIYVAVAKMEWKCYNDKAGGKILERGAKLFPEDAHFMIEYIKYLTAHGDHTNSRVVFETCVNRLAARPETVHKAKPLLAYMHKREAEYGDLARVRELERRMAELYPHDPRLANFGKRFATDKFDPVTARIIVSPAAQLRPRLVVVPSVEKPPHMFGGSASRDSPMPLPMPLGAVRGSSRAPGSPKRAYDDDDAGAPPRKMLRADGGSGDGGGGGGGGFTRAASPLKGAAGRRLDQQRRLQAQGGASTSYAAAGPTTLPTMINFLLGQIPPAGQYNGVRYLPAAVVSILQRTEIDPNAAYEAGRRAGRVHGGGRHGRAASGHDARGYRQTSQRPDDEWYR